MTTHLFALSRQRSTRRTLVMASLVPALTAALAAPVSAAPTGPVARTATAVSEASCSAAGGTYSVAGRVRTCTTVSTRTKDGAVVTSSVGLSSTSWPGGSARSTLIGTSHERTTITTTVTRSQVGTRTPTESSTSRTTTVVVPVDCTERRQESSSGFYDRTDGTWVPGSSSVTDTAMPVERCLASGMFNA